MATQPPLANGVPTPNPAQPTSVGSGAGVPPPHISASSPSLLSSIEGFRPTNQQDSNILSGSGTSLLGNSSSMPNGIPKTANFLNQLESMMNAVKKEASALETMKAKLKDMEELKGKYYEAKTKIAEQEKETTDVKRRLRDCESQNQDLRHDMQQLNDIYNQDRTKFIELQQVHTKLEQDFVNLAMEKDFFLKESQRIPDLKKAIKSGKSNIQQLKTQLEEDRNTFTKQIKDLESKLEKNDKSKAEISQHVWALTEELDRLKKELETKVQEIKTMDSKHKEKVKGMKQVKERYMMVVEDYKIQIENRKEKIKNYQESIQSLKNEKDAFEWTLARKEDELNITSKKLMLLQESYDETVKTLNKNIQSLQETVKDLSTKNSILSQDNQSIKQSLGMKGEDVDKLSNEISRLRQLTQSLESQMNQQDFEAQHTIKSLTTAKDEYSYKLQAATAQVETLQAQIKSDQTKYWDELKRLKETESVLVEETEKMNQELQEKMVYIHTLETEKMNREKSMKSEVSDASNMIQTLKDELEKRVTELVNLRQERDTLNNVKENLEKGQEELKNELKRQEDIFKRTLDNEKQKMKQELQTRSNRIKNLENEKSELLNETQDLMAQISEAQRSSNKYKQSYDDLQVVQQRTIEQLDLTNAKNQELSNEIKKYLAIESDLRDMIKKNEEQAHEELRKFDHILKESKKSASQQILDLNTQIKSLFDEIESYKRSLYDYQDREKKLELEKDKLRQEQEKLQNTIQELQDNSTKEVYNLRREVNETRNKMKIIHEQKTKLEMDVINYNNGVNQLENELNKVKEMNRYYESQMTSSNEQIKTLQGQIDTLNSSKTTLNNRIQELENIINTRNQTIEHLNADFTQLERENIMELRRLKLLLANTEQEINELRPLNHHLTKELNDCKTQLTRIQSNNTSSMNNMIEEIKKLEDGLSRERKQRLLETEEHRRQVKDMEMLLEKTRYELDDYHQKMKIERSEKEIKLHQNDEEMERLRSFLKEKDVRIEELETNHHLHRKKVLELQEKIDLLANECNDWKGKHEMEVSQRKRLEHRMRSMMTTAEINEVHNIPRSRGGNRERDFSGGMGGGGGGNSVSNHLNLNGVGGGGGSLYDDDMSSIGGASSSERLMSARTMSYGAGGGYGGGRDTGRDRDRDRDSGKSSGGVAFNGGQQQQQGMMRDRGDREMLDLDSQTVMTGSSTLYTHQVSYAPTPRGGAGPAAGNDRERSFLQQSFRLNDPYEGRGGGGGNGSVYDDYGAAGDAMSINTSNNNNNNNGNFPSSAFSSPPRAGGGNSSMTSSSLGANSPAVDRVSATLALKLAQQGRMSQGPSAHGNTNTSSMRVTFSRPTSAGQGGSSQYQQQYSMSDPQDDYSMSSLGTGGGGLDFGAPMGGGGGGGNGGNNAVEESIRRTQMILNRKLAAEQAGTNAAAGTGSTRQAGVSSLGLGHSTSSQSLHSNNNSNNGGGLHPLEANKEKTPTSGRSASKLMETIHNAHMMYPASPTRLDQSLMDDGVVGNQNDFGDGDDDDNDLDNEDVAVQQLDESVTKLLIPSLVKPLSPPGVGGGAASSGGAGGGKVVKKKKKKKVVGDKGLPKI